MNRPSITPGVCRIDQPTHRTHGFFVRLAQRGKIHSAFFTDKKHGGREQALAAAQAHYLQLRQKLGLPLQRSRREWAETVRRKGRSGIIGVQRAIDRQVKPWRKYWRATWSPELGVVRKRQFSIRKHGEEKAKQLAIRARRAGVRSMK
ncbi:MAG: AP2/ERF family transcription factor [Verrucomicrobiota bacterium]